MINQYLDALNGPARPSTGQNHPCVSQDPDKRDMYLKAMPKKLRQYLKFEADIDYHAGGVYALYRRAKSPKAENTIRFLRRVAVRDRVEECYRNGKEPPQWLKDKLKGLRGNEPAHNRRKRV